jgi:hypothetical protein
MKWIDVLWAELDEMSEPDQVIAASDYIAEITRSLLPALGRHRRVTVVKILERSDWDSRRLAESIGSRKNAVERLAEEGRSLLRGEEEKRREPAP